MMHSDSAVHKFPVHRFEDGGVQAQAGEVLLVSDACVNAFGSNLWYRHAALIFQRPFAGHAVNTGTSGHCAKQKHDGEAKDPRRDERDRLILPREIRGLVARCDT